MMSQDSQMSGSHHFLPTSFPSVELQLHHPIISNHAFC